MGVEVLADAELDEGDGPVHARLPAVAVAEAVQRFGRHEQQDLGLGLAAQLESERRGRHPVVLHRLIVDQQGALAVLATEPEP